MGRIGRVLLPGTSESDLHSLMYRNEDFENEKAESSNMWLIAVLAMGLATVGLFCIGLFLKGTFSGADSDDDVRSNNGTIFPRDRPEIDYNSGMPSMQNHPSQYGGYDPKRRSGTRTRTKVFCIFLSLGFIGGCIAWGCASPITFFPVIGGALLLIGMPIYYLIRGGYGKY